MSDFAPRRLLLTGGAGFVGSHLAELAVGRVERLVVLDALTYAGRRENLAALEGDPRFVFVRGDVGDRALVERVFAEHAIDAVAHLAAESHVDRSIADGEPFVRTNVLGTFTLLEAARRAWASAGQGTRRLLHVSTDEVYGALGPTGRFDESSPYAPSSPYAASKAGADHLVRAYHVTHGLPAVVTHGSNTYGPRQLAEKLVPVAMTRALAGLPVPLYGEGRQVRSWLHVEDHARGLWLALARGRPGEAYDFGGADELANRAMVERIADAVDEATGRPRGTSRALVTSVADRPGHDFRYAIDDAKARRALGWAPRVALEDGLAGAVRWYMAHPAAAPAP